MSASITAGAAARYPRRPPANANAFDIVRLTTSLWPWVASSSTADGPAENSTYASSTTTSPGAASAIAASSESSIDCPVGLFGVVTNSTSGACSRTIATARSASREKSSRRGAGTHAVRVPAARIGCIEYDGSKPSADRPGPPKACSSCWSTSLDPFAAHRFPTPSPTPVTRVRYAASAPRSAVWSRSG